MKILSIVTILALAFFAVVPGIDLQVSHLFYTEGSGFTYRDHPVSLLIYFSVRIFTLAILMMCLFVIFYDQLRKFFPVVLQKILDRFRSAIKFSRRQIIFLLLVIVITPGILVHWVMKPVWDRARPVNVTEFGGKDQYTNFYHLFAGQNGNSFPSGHAAMATSLIALGFMVSASRRKKVFVITGAYAVLASLCRMWQGGHYLSDVTFSAILTLWTILLIKKFYLDKV